MPCPPRVMVYVTHYLCLHLPHHRTADQLAACVKSMPACSFYNACVRRQALPFCALTFPSPQSARHVATLLPANSSHHALNKDKPTEGTCPASLREWSADTNTYASVWSHKLAHRHPRRHRHTERETDRQTDTHTTDAVHRLVSSVPPQAAQQQS